MEKASFGGPTHWIQVAKLCADFMDRLAPALAPCRAPRTNKGQTSESAGIGNQCVFLGLYINIYIYMYNMYIYMDLEWSESFFGCCFRLASKLVLRVIHLSSISWCFVDPPKNIREIGFCGKPPKKPNTHQKTQTKIEVYGYNSIQI